MTTNPEQALKFALSEARKKADTVLSDSHTGAEAKASITTLLKIGEAYRDLLSANHGASADARVVKKRLDQAKSENRALEEKLATMHKSVLSLATEVEMLGVEAGQILKRNAAHPTSPDHGSATRILTSAHRIIDVVVQLTKGTPKEE